MFSNKLLGGVALTALCVASGTGVAHAQSTASQIQEQIVVTGVRARSSGGLGVQVHVAKDQSVITQEYMQTQVGSANFGQLINLLPGVNYSSEDYTGILSGDFRMHGLDGNHVSVTVDGSPVNDTGNYAVFPGEYLTSEVTARTTVNIGATSVDSPTASAVGGTVDVVSILPSETPGVIFKGSGGSYGYERAFGQMDTGPVGPTGLRAYLAGNYADAQKWKGSGEVERGGIDARIYQPLHGQDFMSVALSWASDRPDFYQSGSRAQLARGKDFDYNTTWTQPTVRPGLADTVPNGTGPLYFDQSDTNYYLLHPNPVDFGQIRGQSRFSLTDKLTLTVDPSFFYTLANGGGGTGVSECDTRLKGPTANCVDLNGDGDTLDTVPLYTPNNTNTHRWLVSSSLLYDLTDTQHFQLAYTVDYGRHRQTGEFTTINLANGVPDSVFGGKTGWGTPIRTADGTILRGRDRFSIAELHQLSANYIGEFMDDKLHVNIGFRDPQFQRDLNNHCYTFNGTSARCDTVSPAAVQTAFTTDQTANRAPGATATALTGVMGTTISTGPGGVPNFRFPFSQTYKYTKFLPNAGVTYSLGDLGQFYGTYAQGFSAPKTDDLYSSSPESVVPESSTEYGVGYRYQTPTVNLSVNLYRTDYKNRIVQSFDPNDPSLSIDRNVGNVRIQGLDLEAGWRPLEHLTLYGSATFVDSNVEQNITSAVTISGQSFAVAVPTKGKELVLTPDQQFSARVQYEVGGFSVGLQGKYQSRRFLSDMNDDFVGAYTTFDLDAKVPLPFVSEHSWLQLNVDNVFDEDYFTRANTNLNYRPIAYTGLGPLHNLNGTLNASSGPFFFLGSPRTFVLTLRTQF